MHTLLQQFVAMLLSIVYYRNKATNPTGENCLITMAIIISPTEKYLLDKRAEIILSLKKEDYPNAKIALIMNLDRATIGRICEAYRKSKNYKS